MGSAIAKATINNSNKGTIGTEEMMKGMQGMQGMQGMKNAVPAALPAALPPQKVIIDIQHNQVSTPGSNNIQPLDNSASDVGSKSKTPNVGSQTKYEDHIQKAVDAAVDRLLTKTKERRAAEEKKRKRRIERRPNELSV